MNKTIRIKVKTDYQECLPFYATEGAAGADVKAVLQESVILLPGSSALIPTGLYFEIPQGYEVQVRPRSGLALKSKITVLNTPGTIDSDYRGEIKVILINHGHEPFIVENGMRIAQIVVQPVIQAEFVCEALLNETVRGVQGFGHSGV